LRSRARSAREIPSASLRAGSSLRLKSGYGQDDARLNEVEWDEVEDTMMSARKSIGGTMLLICFGLVTMYGGEKWLVALIPAAILVWYGTGPALRRGRN